MKLRTLQQQLALRLVLDTIRPLPSADYVRVLQDVLAELPVADVIH